MAAIDSAGAGLAGDYASQKFRRQGRLPQRLQNVFGKNDQVVGISNCAPTRMVSVFS